MNAEKRSCLLIILCLLCAAAQAQETKLESGQTVAREIAGGQSHTYKIALRTGQFARFRLEQETLDSSLLLIAPDGRQIAEVNLTDGGQPESFWLEASQPGDYRLTVLGAGGTAMRGAYRLIADVQAAATAEDRKLGQAYLLLVEGNNLNRKTPPDPTQALEKLEAALSIWREFGDSFWAAITLARIGRSQMLLNRPEKAIETLEQSIAMQRELKNMIGEASTLNTLANVYFNRRQFEPAVRIFEQALARYREAKDRRWEGLVTMSLGNAISNLHQPEKAIEHYEQALAILREVNDVGNQGQTLRSIGNTYITLGKMEKALAATKESATAFREVKDRAQEGLTLGNLGLIYSRLGDSEKAIATFEQILTLFRELKNRDEEANALLSLGVAYGGAGKTEKALEYFEQAAAVSREVKNQRREAMALSNLGLGYQFLNQYEKAIQYLERALPLTREIKDRTHEGNTLSALGATYVGLSRFERAIESHEQALAIFREVKYRLGEANSLANLGTVYKYLGRDDKAIEYYDQALPILQGVKYRVGEGNLLLSLGDSYERVGRLQDSIRAYEQALPIFRELKYQLGEGAALIGLGVGRARENQPEKALAYYEQALPIFREVKDQSQEGLTFFRMGEAKQQLGRAEEAADFFTRSIAIFQAIGSKNFQFGALTALAKSERVRGNLSKGLTTIEESLRIAESLRAELISPETRAAFLTNVQETYQIYTDLLMQSHQANPAGHFDERAVEINERKRARSLLDLLAESRADLRQGVDAALVTREKDLAKQLNDKAEQLSQATKPEQAAPLKLEISGLELELERAQAEIRKNSPRYAALTQPQPLTLKEVQQQLDADTLLLEYSLGPERSYLWAITKDSLTSYELPKEEEIEKSAREVYELLIARSAVKRRETVDQKSRRIARAETQLAAAAQTLSRLALAPVAEQLRDKRLLVVADGALQYTPFAMLPEPTTSAPASVVGKIQPLIVRHEVVSLPSASALAIQRTELAGRPSAPKTLAVIADPVFDRADARMSQASPESEEKTEATTRSVDDERSISHLAEKADGPAAAQARRLVIPRLPYTRQEATRLLALAPKDSTFSAMDFQANRATVLSPELSQYRYVHFATHGVLDSERPGLSSLLLSMVDKQGKSQDGFLRANDIYNLKLPADLVVLSACQTGLGKEIKGEGLVGLTRGFMYAGAARVVVSLWNVDDRATAELMAKFYQKMIKQGERPAAALRAAQVEMWRQKQWQAPYFWAAFTLQGEWR